MKTCLIGSCITRDVWQLANRELPENFLFFARTSIPSIFSDKIELDTAEINLDSPWQVKMVHADINKTAVDQIKNFVPELVIFDFIDDRFDLIQLENRLITRSFEFLCSGLHQKQPFIDATIIPRMSSEAKDLWDNSLLMLKEYFSDPIFKETKFLIHSSKWATKFIKDNVLHNFDEEIVLMYDNKANIKEYNLLMEYYQKSLISALPNVILIEVDEKFRIGCPNHPWGLGPFHFINEYYMDFIAKTESHGLSGSLFSNNLQG